MGWVVVEQEQAYSFLVMDKLCVHTRAVRFGGHLGKGGTGRRVARPKARKAAKKAPGGLLTTVPEERHVLGLLMTDALRTLEGAACISLGTLPMLAKLREMLPPAVELWAGGAGVEHVGALKGVRLITDLAVAESALSDWREKAGA
jgi:hypothetical protein